MARTCCNLDAVLPCNSQELVEPPVKDLKVDVLEHNLALVFNARWRATGSVNGEDLSRRIFLAVDEELQTATD